LPTVTLPSATNALPTQKTKKIQLIASGIFGIVLLLGIIGISRCNSSSNPAVTEALSLWENHKYNAAATALRTAIKADPDAANDSNLAKTLAASSRDPLAFREIDSLLETTALGKSATMAEKLADTAITDEKAVRDSALDLLKGRTELLDAERRARVSFRDAENCPALLNALAALDEQKTSATNEDAARYRGGECNKMIRHDNLCNSCVGRGGVGNVGGNEDDNAYGNPAPQPRFKGKGKKGK
jgi:hypothetical protein